MTSLPIFLMVVNLSLGAGEARPFIKLKDGSTCELFAPTCMVRAEEDYGKESIAEAVRQILNSYRAREKQ